jgi:signal transduction histidine kinase
MGEESEVMAIMENLLSNAQRHGASPILVEVAEKSGAITVSVADSGKVPELDAGKFFKRGFSSHSDGDGIGLDRARTLADLNGGTVSYEPGANGETSFVFTMPSIDSARQDPEPAVAYTSAAH